MAIMPDPIARIHIDPSQEFLDLINGITASMNEILAQLEGLRKRVEALENRNAADDEYAAEQSERG